jgi:hypothetical protein
MKGETMSETGSLRFPSAVMGLSALVMIVLVAVVWPGSSTAGGGHSDYSVNVSKSGNGQGTVTSQPGGIYCGSVCGDSFSLGTMVELSATAAPRSRFAGWTGACSGTGSCVVTTPSDGLPVSVGAAFEKAARPTVKLLSRPTPRLARLRVGCGEDGPPCTLRVTVFLRFWLSKKGYDYYQARSDRVVIKADGVIHRDLAARTGAVGDRMVRALAANPGRKGRVRVIVRNIDTGTQVAINQAAFCGKHPCGTNIKDK